MTDAIDDVIKDLEIIRDGSVFHQKNVISKLIAKLKHHQKTHISIARDDLPKITEKDFALWKASRKTEIWEHERRIRNTALIIAQKLQERKGGK